MYFCLNIVNLNIVGAIAVNADSFSEGSVDRLLSEVECFGNESEILNCSSSKFEGFTCTTSGVVCQGRSNLLIHMYTNCFNYCGH